MPEEPLTYRDAGVDIDEAGRALRAVVDRIQQTHDERVVGGIGAFGGLFRAEFPDCERPLLVSSIDGVGTKTKVASMVGSYRGLGKDIVNHCVNDILCQGARPLFFLDYFACGRLDVGTAATVIEGIAKGCELAGCALIGGETAEMPDMYPEGEYDLAGFAVGAVEREAILDGSRIAVGDVVLGLASSGAHSNGYSLIRRVLAKAGYGVDAARDAELVLDGTPLREALMAPTRIYVRSVLELLRELPGALKGLAHITGGGLRENVPRILPEPLAAHIDLGSWPRPALFRWLQEQGEVAEAEMTRVFNCGIGMVLVVAPEKTEVAEELLRAQGETVYRIGEVVPRVGDELQARIVGSPA
ncbi:MAG TPA: phosphoribosylformylglycinamidine cyclo-ligase [Armatimonadetes bacterium]|nr:phosphoribosylformylglycinamidine cyclo-ligase [Armatimonadota bacterium]